MFGCNFIRNVIYILCHNSMPGLYIGHPSNNMVYEKYWLHSFFTQIFTVETTFQIKGIWNLPIFLGTRKKQFANILWTNKVSGIVTCANYTDMSFFLFLLSFQTLKRWFIGLFLKVYLIERMASMNAAKYKIKAQPLLSFLQWTPVFLISCTFF